MFIAEKLALRQGMTLVLHVVSQEELRMYFICLMILRQLSLLRKKKRKHQMDQTGCVNTVVHITDQMCLYVRNVVQINLNQRKIMEQVGYLKETLSRRGL